MDAKDFIAEDQQQQKQTHITFDNPDHPDTSAGYTTDEKARQHFNAANSIQQSPIDRKMIVGDFLVAIEEELKNEDSDAIQEFFERLED